MHTDTTETVQNLREVLVSILRHNGIRWGRFIAAILRNEADADDVIQEAVRRVLARNLPFSSEEHVRRYLSRAIANSALALYKSRKRERRKHIPIEEQILMPARVANPYVCIEERELSFERDRQLGMLQAGLMSLSAKQIEALRLTILDCHGSSIRDIGMNNGIPYSTLRHRSQQGLRRLRKYLQREGRNRRQESGDRKQESE
jgi:RNA polymerase sigma factor (sigma-70 family)